MAITKNKKKEIVQKLTDALKGSQSVAFVHFKGLSVSDTSAMRTQLRSEGVGYTVAKKTLIHRALDEQGYEGERPALEGEIALAYADDLTAPAREVYAFQKKHKDKLTIVGGIFDGVYKSQEEMTDIASIPGILVLRGQFVNLINSPIQGLVIALNAIAEKKEA